MGLEVAYVSDLSEVINTYYFGVNETESSIARFSTYINRTQANRITEQGDRAVACSQPLWCRLPLTLFHLAGLIFAQRVLKSDRDAFQTINIRGCILSYDGLLQKL